MVYYNECILLSTLVNWYFCIIVNALYLRCVLHFYSDLFLFIVYISAQNDDIITIDMINVVH